MTHHEGLQNPDQQNVKAKTPGASSRFSNVLNVLRTAARTSPVLVALLGGADAGCSSVNVDASPGSTVEGCSPMPDCPNFPPYPNATESLYDSSGRWRRIDPTTHKEFMVCDPTVRNFCADGQTPEADGCSLPVCENAKTCDPIPSSPSHDVWRSPDHANFPTSTDQYFNIGLNYVYENETLYPTIYDNVPVCQPDESPAGETYYSCDVIPTCPEEKLLKYCDPLPRCADGQQSIKVEDQTNFAFGDLSQCLDYMNTAEFITETRGSVSIFGKQNETSLSVTACAGEVSNGTTLYRPPRVEVVCIPTRECLPGEVTASTHHFLVQHIDAGKWGSWTSTSGGYELTCDPIPTCNP